MHVSLKLSLLPFQELSFSPDFAIDLHGYHSVPSVTSCKTVPSFDCNRKHESGRWLVPFLTAFFKVKTTAKSSLFQVESKSEFQK